MGDMNYNPYGTTPQQVPRIQRGNVMESAAMFLGTSSLILCSCLYVSIPFGALAILFALLSRGARSSMSTRARNAMILGIAGIVVTILVYTYSFYYAIQEAGSLENLLRQVCEQYGYDFELLFGEYFQ